MGINNIRKSYKLYKKEAEYPIVDIKDYINITTMYIKFIMKKVVDGVKIVLPCSLGELYVVGRKKKPIFLESGKIRNAAPDWVATKKLRDSNEKARKERTVVYHTNDHTDGYIYKIYWERKDCFVKNKFTYAIRFTREHKRAVHKNIMEGKEYINF